MREAGYREGRVKRGREGKGTRKKKYNVDNKEGEQDNQEVNGCPHGHALMHAHMHGCMCACQYLLP